MTLVISAPLFVVGRWRPSRNEEGPLPAGGAGDGGGAPASPGDEGFPTSTKGTKGVYVFVYVCTYSYTFIHIMYVCTCLVIEKAFRSHIKSLRLKKPAPNGWKSFSRSPLLK